METGEVKNEKVYASRRLSPKISLKHDWMKELGSEVARQPEGVARQPEGEVVTQSKSSQLNQLQTQIMIDRGNPLLELAREPCKMEERRPVPRRSM